MLLGRADRESFNALGIKYTMLLQSFMHKEPGVGEYEGHAAEV